MDPQKTLVLRALTQHELTQLNAIDGPIHVYDLNAFKALDERPNVQYTPFKKEHQRIAQNTVQQGIDTMAESNGQQSIVDVLDYEGLHLWYYHRTRAFYDVYNIYLQLLTLRELDGDTNYKVYANRAAQSKTQANKHLSFVPQNKIKTPLKSKIGSIKYLTSLCIRGILGLGKLRALKNITHLLLLFPNVQTSKIPTTEYYGQLLEIDSSGSFGLLDIHKPAKKNDGRIRWNISSLFRKTKYPLASNDAILLRYGFLRISAIQKAKRYSQALQDQLKTLDNYSTSEIQDLLIEQFASYRSSSAYYTLIHHAYLSFLKKSQIQSITTHSEQDSIVRTILDAGKLNGITTNGIQHGAINKSNRAYFFKTSDQAYKPFPDHMLVWGTGIRDFLVNDSGCAQEGVVVLGQLRSDTLMQPSNTPQHSIYTSIPKSHTKIIFASQPQPDLSLRKQAAIDTIAAANEINDLTLIIKVHPGEDKAYYQSIINEMNAQHAIVVKDEIELYPLIEHCDALMTCYSTVGAETVYFNKPLLVLDYLRLDQMNFIAEGVGKAVTTAQEIRTQLQMISENTFQIDQNQYDHFVEKYAYKLDGKTAERYYKFIQEKKR